MEKRRPERESGERGTPKPPAILSKAPQGTSLFPLLTVEGVGPAQQLQVGLENLPFLTSSHLHLWGETDLPLGGLTTGDQEKSIRAPLGTVLDWCKVHKCSSGTGLSALCGSLGKTQGHLPVSLLLPLAPMSPGAAQGPSMFTAHGRRAP